MHPRKTPRAKTLRVPADIDAATAVEAHERLLHALDAAESAGVPVSVEFDPAESAPTPLALQLLVSAQRSFPADLLRLRPGAAADLATIEHPKEN